LEKKRRGRREKNSGVEEGSCVLKLLETAGNGNRRSRGAKMGSGSTNSIRSEGNGERIDDILQATCSAVERNVPKCGSSAKMEENLA